MKARHCIVILFVFAMPAYACESQLVGGYSLKAEGGEFVETTRIQEDGGELRAYILGESGWEEAKQHPAPLEPEMFQRFIRQPLPDHYCGVMFMGVLLVKVPVGWEWAGFTAETGYVIIGLGGPRNAVRRAI